MGSNKQSIDQSICKREIDHVDPWQRKIRNSAVTDEPCDAFVPMQWRGWPPPTTLPICYHVRPIWSFFFKACTHRYGRTPEIGERWGSAPSERGRDWPPKTSPSPYVLPDQIW